MSRHIPSEAPRRLRRIALATLRWICAAALLAFAARGTRWRAAGAALAGAWWPALIGPVVINGALLSLRAWRLQLLLGPQRLRWFDSLRALVVGAVLGADVSLATALEEYARLERAERRLDESKRLGAIAHEMRNALTSARLAYSQLKLGKFGINSKTGDVLGRGLTAAEALVRQMLASVQLEAGAPVVRQPIRLEELLGVLRSAMIPQRGVDLTWEIEPDLTVMADERLLLSAATNILQNALKFTRDGGAVAVRARRDQTWVTIEVEDEWRWVAAGRGRDGRDSVRAVRGQPSRARPRSFDHARGDGGAERAALVAGHPWEGLRVRAPPAVIIEDLRVSP